MTKKIIFSIVLLLFTASFALALAPTVEAQGLKSAGELFKKIGSNAGAAGYGDVQSVAGAGIKAALTLVGLIFMILMIYGGYLWMTARGEEETIKKAQKIIVGSIIGLVIVVAAYAITAFITKSFP